LVYTSAYQEESEKKSSTLALDDNESQEETIEKIKKAMVKLSDRQQEVLHLKFQVGLSYPEIAKILEISVESVRTLVYRAVKTIKEELKVNSKALILFHIQVPQCWAGKV
jgi:RNA polymerase sigma factor (sigma-70 family)